MKPDTIMIDEYIPVIKLIEFMGWKATKPRNKNCNGVDIYAIGVDRVLSIEVKRAVQPKGKNGFRVRRVEKKRCNDDLIAIVFPSQYVLLEPMQDHLRCCNKQGDRFLNY